MSDQQPPQYQVGDVVNGHRWNGVTWEPVEAVGTTAAGGAAGPGATPAKKAWYRKWWGIAGLAFAALIVIGAIFGGGGDTADTPASADATQTASPDESQASTEEASDEPSEEEASEEPSAEETPEAAAMPSFPGDGIFEVGADIKAGLYRSEGSGYWERLKDATGEFDSIIANGNASGQVYVQIKKSDGYFSTDGMSDWVLVDPDAKGERATSFDGDGIFMVGIDIKPGTYKAQGSGYWARLKGATGEFDDIIANDNPEGNAIVTIKDTDKFFETNGMEGWKRSG